MSDQSQSQGEEQADLSEQPAEVVDDVGRGCFGSAVILLGIVLLLGGTIVAVILFQLLR